MKEFKIKLTTVMGEDDLTDSLFLQYLDEYSISYKILDEKELGYPVVEYTSGPISLRNMMMERFGFEREDISENYPFLLD
jgi:hypothetical protein